MDRQGLGEGTHLVVRRTGGHLNRIGSFAELVAEQRYRLQFLREDGWQRTLLMAAIALGYATSAPNDFVFFDGRPGLFALAVASRIGLFGIGIFGAIVLRCARWPRQQDWIFHAALVGFAVAISVNHLTRILVGRVIGTLVGSGTLLGLLYFAVRGPILPRAIFGAIITMGVVGMVIAPHGNSVIDPQAAIAVLTAFAALNVVGIMSARSFEQQRRQRFESERRERHARLVLAQRMHELAREKDRAEAMSRARAAFLAAMSHEFRTPMNAIIGLSDIVLDTPFGPESRTRVGAINDSARALLRLLEDILDFAKIDAQKLTLVPMPFDLRRLAMSVIEMFQPSAAAASVDLQAEIAAEVPSRLLGDDARLRQALVNLIGNAVKFTRHGKVRLQISVRDSNADGQTIAFRVEDTGVGMTPDVLARLFRPFEQGDAGHARRHGGTGLGLAISKQIVVAMGGDIQVESHPGRGSIFSFALQLAVAKTEAEAAPRTRSRPPLSILVVDDHPLNREVACAKLGRLGYAADMAEDGKTAIAAAAHRSYDVIFLDLHMPEMNGLEAAARLFEVTAGRSVPHVVAMTASVFDEDREACRRAGMRDFVGKPVELAALDAVLTRVAEERGAVVPAVAPSPVGPADSLRQLASVGDPLFFERVCRVFLSSTHERIARMRDALGRGNTAQLALDAHTLKSASAAFGAIELSEPCAQLEMATRAGLVEGAAEAITTIEAQFAAIERTLLAEIDGAEA